MADCEILRPKVEAMLSTLVTSPTGSNTTSDLVKLIFNHKITSKHNKRAFKAKIGPAED